MSQEKQIEKFKLLAMRSFLINSQDLIFFKDMHLKYMGASLAFAHMVGCESEEELVGKSDFDIFGEDLARHYTEVDRNVLESGIPIIDLIEPLPDKEGKKSYSSTSKYRIYDSNGNVIGLCGIGRDVTAQVELEEERERRELSRQMFEDVLEADVTENKLLRMDSSRWVKEIGLNANTTFQEAVKEFANYFVHKDFREEFQQYYDMEKLVSDYETGIEEFSHVTYQSVDGKAYKWTEFCSRLYYSKVSNTLRITTFLKDLDNEIKTQQLLRRKAENDALTGLLNREGVIQRVSSCLKNSEPGITHVLLFVDLDNFKQVNDSLGHPFGDKVLKRIANSLKLAFRHDDIVGRIGGDEFLILLKHVTSLTEAKKRAEHIFGSILFQYRENGYDLRVTCSVGAAVFTGGKSFEQLYVEADEAMYHAKKLGKNTLVFYTE